MRLKRLIVRNFRNVDAIDFEPHPILNFLVGDNAQGKTSLIEAIYFLSSLKSFRTSRTSDLQKFGANVFQIVGNVESEFGTTELKARVESSGKTLLVGEKKVTSVGFIKSLRAVVFSPESLASVKSGPDLRRDLIDSAVFQLFDSGAKTQSTFLRTLKQRNACLKQIKSGEMSPSKGRAVLESLDEGFLQAAAELTHQRLVFLDSITPKNQRILAQILGEKVDFQIVYQSHQSVWMERSIKEIHERLKKEVSSTERRAAEEALGVTLTGPHRHDVTFLFNENDSRNFCSQGQQRAVILSFKIAEIVYHYEVFGSFPLLLLDDVFSEFDEKKRHFLVEFLRSNEAQTFLTATDETLVLQGCSEFRIEAGHLMKTRA